MKSSIEGINKKLAKQEKAQDKEVLTSSQNTEKYPGSRRAKRIKIETPPEIPPFTDQEEPFLVDGKPVTFEQIKEWEKKGEISLIDESSEHEPSEEGYSPIPTHAFHVPKHEHEKVSKQEYEKAEAPKERNTSWFRRLFRERNKPQFESEKINQTREILAEESESHWTDALARESDSERMARKYQEEQDAREKKEMEEYHQWAEHASTDPSRDKSYELEHPVIEMDTENDKERREAA